MIVETSVNKVVGEWEHVNQCVGGLDILDTNDPLKQRETFLHNQDHDEYGWSFDPAAQDNLHVLVSVSHYIVDKFKTLCINDCFIVGMKYLKQGL